MQALDIPFYQSNILLLVSLTDESSSSLYQDVSHGFDFTVSVIWTTALLCQTPIIASRCKET